MLKLLIPQSIHRRNFRQIKSGSDGFNLLFYQKVSNFFDSEQEQEVPSDYKIKKLEYLY